MFLRPNITEVIKNGPRTPLVSVIIPVYRTEPGMLRKSVDSVCRQKGIPLELILVLDGIQEKQRLALYESCAQVMSDDFSVKLIEQDHCGVSAARNVGIKEARAKWICFLDSDDQLEADGLKRLCMADADADMVIGGYNVTLGSRTYSHHCATKGRVFAAEDDPEDRKLFLQNVLNPQSGFGFCWGKLFLRERVLASGIFFDEGLSLGEDVNFVFRYGTIAARICCVPGLVYRYNTHLDSAVRRFSQDYRECCERAMLALGSALKETGYYRLLYQDYQSCVLYHFLLITVNDSFHPDRIRKDGLVHSIKQYSRLAKEPMYHTAVREGRVKNFSFTRRITVWLIRLKNYPLIALAAFLRHRQRGRRA